jgi:putative transposase
MWRRDKHDRGTHPEFGNLDAARVTAVSQMRELAELRQVLSWLAEGSSSVQQAALRDLDRAYGNFYAGRARYPSFKRRNTREGSFAVRDLVVRRLNKRWGTMAVPKMGPVRFRITRAWADIQKATSARVTLRNGRWHVAFTTLPGDKTTAGRGAVVGIDRGVQNTLATSDSQMAHAPVLTAVEQIRFVRLQQQLARQDNQARRTKNWDSKRRIATLDRLAVLRRRLQDRRTDWVEQTTTYLARTYDLVAVEDLRVQTMVRRPPPRPDPENEGAFLPNGGRAKAALNRAIFASLWGRFLTRLEDKMPPGHVVRVDPKDTSRTCAACGHCASENRDSQAVFECQACGHAAHADSNAAVNILDRALSTMAAGHTVSGRGNPAPAGSVNQTRRLATGNPRI